jgi:alkaline phosphatase D
MKYIVTSVLLSISLNLASQNLKIIERIAFGSCSDQNEDQSILYHVANRQPDLFIYLGDNIYGDSKDMDVLDAKYHQLAAKLPFQALKDSCEILATWDDHDYGKNDAGKGFAMKQESKALFLKFWKEPGNSKRYEHDGIYHSEYYQHGNDILQVILLDTRTFRTRLKYSYLRFIKYKNSYRPNYSETATILGAAQWLWLEAELSKEASIRIIASSNQFAHEYNGYESWTNFPLEQERMLKLIQKTQANGVFFISGDVHWGELSRMENEFTYPIFDCTSSGLTQTWHKTEANIYRKGPVISESNFGFLDIDWLNRNLRVQLYDEEDRIRLNYLISFDELSF